MSLLRIATGAEGSTATPLPISSRKRRRRAANSAEVTVMKLNVEGGPRARQASSHELGRARARGGERRRQLLAQRARAERVAAAGGGAQQLGALGVAEPVDVEALAQPAVERERAQQLLGAGARAHAVGADQPGDAG